MSLAPDEFRVVIDTNLVGTFLGTRAAMPSMRRRGGDSIVSINSTAGIGATVGLAACGTSKWGIRGLTRIGAKELGRENIRVNGVHPGIIETSLAYDPAARELIVGIDDQPIPRLADVDEVSSPVLFVATDDAGYSTGAEFVAGGGYLLGPVPAAKL
jgi:3alpha(or 20beta)-hydroxysteroid dehydrogenase